MNLNQVRVFVAVAEEGNITKAAQKLHISQPAVSKQLSELEASIGANLFTRIPRGVVLTDAGAILLQHARKIFAAELAAEIELAQLVGLGKGRLSIGASTTIGSYLLPSVFGMFSQAHPNIELELAIANTSVIQTWVLEDRVDLGLTEGLLPSNDLSVEPIYYDKMVVIVSKKHPLLLNIPVKLHDLCRVPLISRESGSGTRAIIEAALQDRGMHLEPVMALGSTEAVKNAVAYGLGFAIVSSLAVELECSVGQLAILEVSDLQISRTLHLVQKKSKKSTPMVEAFLNMLRVKLS